jgi:L-amino acid N-acyltransferase YncA
MKIRKGILKDLERIDEIYLEGVIDEIQIQFPKRTKSSIIKEMGKAQKSRRTQFKKDFKSKNNYWVVAEKNKDIVGFANAEINNKEGKLTMLYIQKPFRNKGIGKKLTKARIKWIKSKKAKTISAGILLKNNASISNLKSFGFKPVSIKLEKKLK